MSVSELNKNMKKLIDSRPGLRDITIKGELSNFKISYPSGHIYLTLKDEGGVLKACMFRPSAAKLEFEPKDGMKVLARGRISVFEAGGVYQLYIEQMQPDGIGDLYVAFLELKKKLEEEGLFDKAHKKPIPKFPKRVGVITSDTGAAVRDVINVITRRYQNADIFIYPTKVQGEGAAQQVAQAIEFFNDNKAADVLIVGRGGGSIEDLWAFNEEVVARAVYKSEIPIISAVGHETDFTICDFCADLRAPTPSAAAEIAVPSGEELKHRLFETKARLGFLLRSKAFQKRQKLKSIAESSTFLKFDRKFAELRQKLDIKAEDIEKAIKTILLKKNEKLKREAKALDALSPLAVLVRGYCIAESESGVWTSVNDVKEERATLRFADGAAEVLVSEVRK